MNTAWSFGNLAFLPESSEAPFTFNFDPGTTCLTVLNLIHGVVINVIKQQPTMFKLLYFPHISADGKLALCTYAGCSICIFCVVLVRSKVGTRMAPPGSKHVLLFPSPDWEDYDPDWRRHRFLQRSTVYYTRCSVDFYISCEWRWNWANLNPK